MMVDAPVIAREAARLNYPLPFIDAIKLYNHLLRKMSLHTDEDLDSVMLYTYVKVNRHYNPQQSKVSYYFYSSLKNNIKAHIRTRGGKSAPYVLRPAGWNDNIEEWQEQGIIYNLDEWLEIREDLERFKTILTDKEKEFLEYSLQHRSIPEICRLMGITDSRGYQFSSRLKELWEKRGLNNRGNTGKATVTHCKYGHPFTPENTRYDKKGWKKCVTCKRYHDNQYSYRKKNRS